VVRAAAVIATVAICGCGSSDPRDELAFDFELRASPGFMDQTLAIENHGGSGLAPVLELTPLDSSGDPMPGVRVRTAYGSDRGRVVVPPRSTVVDVLRFEGPGARDVEDVDVRVGDFDEVSVEAADEEPVVQRFDRRGRPVGNLEVFDSYRVSNGNDAEIAVRVVLIEWEEPPPGESQQAIRVTPISPVVTIAPNGEETMRLPEELRGRVVGSVKTYFSR
jgi:hypothetical protein